MFLPLPEGDALTDSAAGRLPLGIQTPARHRPGRQKKAAEPFPPTIHCKRLQAMPA